MRLNALLGITTAGALAVASASCVIYTRDPASARPPPPGPPPADAPHGHADRPPPPPPARSPTMVAAPPAEPNEQEELGVPSRTDVVQPAPAQPAFEEPAEAATNPELLPPGVAAGRPPGFRPGAPAGFWIWQGPRGSWLLRTTTKDAEQLFRGRIAGLTGEIVNVHPQRTEFRDRVRRGPKGWAFSFATQSHADGFTFMTSDGGCVVFDLQLDGASRAKRVFVGHGEHQPRGGHFVVCPPGKGPPPPPPR